MMVWHQCQPLFQIDTADLPCLDICVHQEILEMGKIIIEKQDSVKLYKIRKTLDEVTEK